MELGQKVKTEIIDGIWFVGTYTDNHPDSDSIVVTNKKMAMIIPKNECVLAERSNDASGLHLHSVISRFRFSLTMIGLALAGIFMMMTFTWTIYWLITGSNFMNDFQKIADNLP